MHFDCSIIVCRRPTVRYIQSTRYYTSKLQAMRTEYTHICPLSRFYFTARLQWLLQNTGYGCKVSCTAVGTKAHGTTSPALTSPFELHYGRSSIRGKDIAYYTASLANSPQDARGVRSTTLNFLAALLVVVVSYSGREEAARCYDVGT